MPQDIEHVWLDKADWHAVMDIAHATNDPALERLHKSRDGEAVTCRLATSMTISKTVCYSTMTDVFRSPQLTLIRAHHHIRDFHEIVNRFVAEKPWTRFVDKNSNPGKDLHKVKFRQQLPEMLPCILFDATNNLRAVLDQGGYASAVAARRSSLKATKFPFGPTEEKFRNNLAGGCKDLPPEIRDLFGSYNAYKGGNNTLWALNEIANADFFSARIINDQGISDIVSPGGFGIGWDPEKYEIILMSTQSGSHVDVDINVTFTVAIDGIETLESKSMIGVIDDMACIVERILLATKAECRRLGFIT